MAYGEAISALADPTRRAVFERLRRGPSPVGELARELPVSRPAVSQHLRVLKDAGVLNERREGTRRLYSIRPEAIESVRQFLEDLWPSSLANLKSAVEKRRRSTRPPTSA